MPSKKNQSFTIAEINTHKLQKKSSIRKIKLPQKLSVTR